MARVKNTMKLIEMSKGRINERYDICSKNFEDILDASTNQFETIAFAFRYGYMQGMKATRTEMKKAC